MADESTAATGSGTPAVSAAGSQLPPAERARLAKCFTAGGRALEGRPPNLEYAIEMFSACVRGDPSSPVFVKSLLGTLKQKHGGKKTGGLSGLWQVGPRSALKKLAAKAQWRDVLAQGIEFLKSNPSEVPTLLAMAEACGNLLMYDSQGIFLQAALEAAPKDADVNRACARFMANLGQFDQAIACWVRIKDLKGLGEEADREIARLQVEKTIVAGRGMAGRQATVAPTPPQGGERPSSATDQLRRRIKENPTGIEPYLELADVLERDATLEEAEKVLADALAASGNDIKVIEHVEDRQLRWGKHRVLLAEKRLAAEDTPAARTAVERLRSEHLRREIDVYAARCSRYPENVIWKYELAMRLKAAGNHTEAIRHFQEVLQDPRRKGVVSLELGECFQKIRQYDLALRNYQSAVELLTDRELEHRKRALYRAGVLATGLGDADTARKHLSTLGGLDFGYRDVRERLDKLASVNDNRGLGSASAE